MSENDAAKSTSNDLDALIERLCAYLDEHRVEFSGKQLSEAGELYERYDHQTARMVVQGKDDANTLALAHVLDEVHRAKLSPDKAAYLIRHLSQIRKNRRKNP
jgi:myosin-crossreactive antigen